jgi:hypothetical protein
MGTQQQSKNKLCSKPVVKLSRGIEPKAFSYYVDATVMLRKQTELQQMSGIYCRVVLG